VPWNLRLDTDDVNAASLADRRYHSSSGSLIRAYALLEALIASWVTSDLSHGAIAVVLLTPMTVLMGGTLTVLIRAVVPANPGTAGWS
jgi:hypothetical protein